MDEDKKENFRMEIVKKAWFSQRFNMLVEVYLPLMFHTCVVETMKLCISLSLLLANLCFPGGHCIGRNSLSTSSQHKQLKVSASLQ